VPFIKRAWHAGVSSFNGVDACNDYSVGIELEGTDNSEYTIEQYKMLAKLTDYLIYHYPQLTKQRIVAHSDIAPERKSDPGEFFDWQHYFSLLA
jgi:AmpD protein